jgi:hypothetical protein
MNGRQADVQEAKKIRLRERFAALLNPNGWQTQLSAVTAQVDDSPGWVADKRQPHERDFSEVQALYEDALAAYRKNPIAWRVIATTTNYILGDSLVISSPKRELERFIRAFWDHPKNRMDLRLAQMSDELARAGDLFVVLFRNPQDGMSYLRFVTKDRIVRIESAENDWENELAFYEAQESGEPRRWLSPSHPGASESEAVMLHYAVNRPCGALLGESDLASMLPWLQRYSRMLEDRVRLHWAMRAFLWVITVPTNLVGQKAEQYRTPPEAGSIVVKDQSEEWQAVAPDLKGADASHDLKAVRGMIDAGSGYPPHWRGEGGEANLAPAPLRVLRVEYPDGRTPPRYLAPIPKTDPRFWGGAYYEVVGEPPTDIFLGEEAAAGEVVEVSYTAIHTLPTQDASVLRVPDIHLEALILFCLWKAAEEILMAEAINPDSLEFLVPQKGLNVIRLERVYRSKIWEFQQSSSSRVAGFWRTDGADRIY